MAFSLASEFTDPSNPAPSSSHLFALLRQEAETSFIYRGQTRQYAGPLLPSQYRAYLSSIDDYIGTEHPLARYAIRGCGQRFYGDYNFKMMHAVENLFASLARVEANEAKLVFDKAMNGANIAIVQLNSRVRGNFCSWLETLEHRLSPQERLIYGRYAREWKPFLDRYHRRIIRMFFFHMIFGYFMGSVLAQQYGVNSGLLDATTSLEVAFFFATHASRDDFVSEQADGVGAIYRFPYEHTPVNSALPDDFCSLPIAIDAARVLEQFTEDDTEPATMMRDFQRHFRAVYEETTNGRRKWSFGSIKSTRVWRQAAVVMVPDELRRDLPGKGPAVGGIVPPAFQYIEDLACRRGVEVFYFRHGSTSSTVSSLTREYLWPREDALLPLLVSGMTAVYPIRRFSPHFIPYRLDLIDAGFQKDEFRVLCEHYAQEYPLILWGDDDLDAVAMGKMVV